MSDTNTTTADDATDLVVDFDAYTTAVAKAEAAFAAASALAPSIRVPGVHLTHVLAYGADQSRPAIKRGLQSLAYLSQQGVARGDAVDSVKRAIIAAANAMETTFCRVVDPATCMAELGRMYSAIPGAVGNPFYVAPPAQDDDPVVLPTYLLPGHHAMEVLRTWGYRGVRAERIGDNITLAGPYTASDVATVKEYRAHLLPLLPETVTI